MSSGHLRRSLPPELQPLAELALDQRFTGSQFSRRIWRRLDPEASERTNNPFVILHNAQSRQSRGRSRRQNVVGRTERMVCATAAVHGEFGLVW